MFTGIVQSVGTVVQGGRRLVVQGELPYRVQIGGSVAVNGCCLTHVGGDALTFDLSEETIERTTLGGLKEGNRVNLEAALRAGDAMGGHFVQGHVDAIGEFLKREGEAFRFRVDDAAYLVDKGSICIDGVSLTVVEPDEGEFTAAVISHTLANTNLADLVSGERVNVEYDALAKYLHQLLKKGGAR